MKLIDENFVKSLVSYLSTRPYHEVEQAIPVLKNLPDFIPPQEEKL